MYGFLIFCVLAEAVAIGLLWRKMPKVPRGLTETNWTEFVAKLYDHTEVIAAFHRRLREGVFSPAQYKQVLEQFEVDCGENAYRWLPLSPAVTAPSTTIA